VDDPVTVTHIAGVPLTVGSHLRQRCGWCGAVLIDVDLDRIAVQEGQDPTPATWQPGLLVGTAGENPKASWLIEHAAGDNLPGDACAQLDHGVTL
jgi:hypothetical protein